MGLGEKGGRSMKYFGIFFLVLLLATPAISSFAGAVVDDDTSEQVGETEGETTTEDEPNGTGEETDQTEERQEGFLPTTAPKIFNVVGQGPVTYDAVRYPKFSNFDGERGCTNYVIDNVNNQYKQDPTYVDILSRSINFEDVFGVEEAKTYRKTAKILVEWNIRVEGDSSQTERYDIWLDFCKPNGYGWHGTVTQTPMGGEVYTRLAVDGDSYSAATMTVPSGESLTRTRISDPTITGSTLLTPADFGGEFPNQINFEIEWKNDSGMFIRSPAEMRSMVITINPVEL